MATLHRETDLLESILAECDEDYVGLWSIYRRMKEARFADSKQSTLNLVGFLLSTGAIEAGLPDRQGVFHRWNKSSDEVVRQIDQEWSSLGREPDIGDIVWFTTPPDE